MSSRTELDRRTLARRALNQWLDGADDRHTRPVFVLGSDPGAADPLVAALITGPQTWHYATDARLAFDDEGRIRGPAVVDTLLWLTPADVVVFEPLHDSHLADRLLALHEGARAVWVYRPWRAAAAEAAAADGAGIARALEDLAAERFDALGWRGERLPAGLVDQVRALSRDGLDPATAAALDWYVRNSFLFSLGLEDDPRVMVVDATRPDPSAIATFLGLTHVPLAPVPEPSVDLPPIAPEAAALCDALQHRLEQIPMVRQVG